MYRKLFLNDIKNNLLQTFSISLFVLLSVAFLATAGGMTVQLVSSIHTLLQTAKTPHILQMHTGSIDQARLHTFVKMHPQIEQFQVLDFLNLDNSILSFHKSSSGKAISLKDSVYDNGFSVQSPAFDYLLNLHNEIITVKKGEVYVPIFYQSSGLAGTGDILKIQSRQGEIRLRVAGFVRDSQMNSSLSSSKRFLVSHEDFSFLQGLGTMEHLIEFRLKDLRTSSEIESAYAAYNLESSGPPLITYSLFQLVNAFSDGITIVTLLLISLLIIGISLLCIRFSLLAKLEEDSRELSVLKAIGISLKERKMLFLSKYLFLSAISCISGFFLSFVLKIPLLHNMKMFFGESKETPISLFVAAMLSLSVFLTLLGAMLHLARRVQTIPMTHTVSLEETKNYPFLRRLPQVLHLVLSDIFSRKKLYLTMVSVFILAVFVLTLPMSIYSTISNRQFIHYLGLSDYDLRIDLSQTAEKEGELRTLLNELHNDSRIAKWDIFHGKMIDFREKNGAIKKLWVEFGNPNSFPIQYLTGSAPSEEDEIALSKLKADDLSLKVGDTLTLLLDGKSKVVRISGIYSDLTNGGKTAKANFPAENSETIWTVIPVTLKSGYSAGDFSSSYSGRYPFAKFSDTENYLQQIFGNTITMVKMIHYLAFATSLFLIFLIVALFIKMISQKAISENALLRALGFTTAQIRRQFYLKTAILLAVGIMCGNLLSISLGDSLGRGILSLIGVAGIQFVRNIFFTYLLIPLAMLLSALAATRLGIAGLEKNNIAQSLKEEIL